MSTEGAQHAARLILTSESEARHAFDFPHTHFDRFDLTPDEKRAMIGCATSHIPQGFDKFTTNFLGCVKAKLGVDV
jgi:hypothetical protein